MGITGGNNGAGKTGAGKNSTVVKSGGRPKISVVMPVYNADRNLRVCLDDLIKQTLTDIEIICVDDGSDDCSCTILQDYAKRYRHFHFVKQKHSGAAAARNYGISMASGKYLSILDCDDRFEPDMLESLWKRAEEKNADIVICGCDGFKDSNGRTVPMLWALDCSMLPQNDPFNINDVPSRIFGICFGWAWDKLFRTDFIRARDIRFQDLDASNDMYFTFTALAEAERITVLRKVLVHQRTGQKNSVSSSRHRNTDCFYYSLTALRERLKSDGLYETAEQSFKNWAVTFCAWQLNTLTGHPDAFMELYNSLHDRILPDMDIKDDNELYYHRKFRRAYKQCLEIQSSTLDEYLYRRWQSGTNTKKKLLLRRKVGEDGMTVLKPVFSDTGRVLRAFSDCTRTYGLGYTLELLIGMAAGGRR